MHRHGNKLVPENRLNSPARTALDVFDGPGLDGAVVGRDAVFAAGAGAVTFLAGAALAPLPCKTAFSAYSLIWKHIDITLNKRDRDALFLNEALC